MKLRLELATITTSTASLMSGVPEILILQLLASREMYGYELARFKAIAHHLSFNQLDDWIKLSGRKGDTGRKRSLPSSRLSPYASAPAGRSHGGRAVPALPRW